MKEYLSIDGNNVSGQIPLRALFYGEGVFETFRYRDSLPVLLDKHLGRLESGAKLLKIPFPEKNYIIELINNSVIEANINDAYVKIYLLSKGNTSYLDIAADSQLLVIIKEYESISNPVKLKVNSFRRISTSPLNNIKSMNYLQNVLARREALGSGFDESIFLNEWGEITECSASNIFWFKDYKLFTPHTSCGLLNGTTRSNILELVNDLKFSQSEGGYLLDTIYDAEFVFVTNSLIGSVPVFSVEDKLFDTKNPHYLKIQNTLFEKLGWL